MKLNPVAKANFLFGPKAISSLIAFILLVFIGVATWQLGQINPPAPYRAPLLNLHLTGAAVGNFDFSAAELITREVSPAGFTFTTEEDAELGFRLEFSGASEARGNAVYNLSADYPLTLTLFEGEAVSTTFTATEGTAEFNNEGGRVAAFMTDESGRSLFVGANFAYSEDEACSETYRFCFNAGELAARGE